MYTMNYTWARIRSHVGIHVSMHTWHNIIVLDEDIKMTLLNWDLSTQIIHSFIEAVGFRLAYGCGGSYLFFCWINLSYASCLEGKLGNLAVAWGQQEGVGCRGGKGHRWECGTFRL